METSLVGTMWDVEYALTLSLAPIGLLVAIGDKHRSLGAAKFIETDEEWRNRFAVLCANARAIFVLPGTSSSVIWEISKIYNSTELSSKSFFIMPPDNSGFFINLIRELRNSDNNKYWSQIKFELSSAGINLPKYSKNGGVFALSLAEHNHVHFSIDFIRAENIDALLSRNRSKIIPRPKPWYENFFWRRTIFTPGAIFNVFIGFVIAMIFRDFMYQPFNIPSGSLVPSVLVGDYVYVAKFAYGYSGYSFGSRSEPGKDACLRSNRSAVTWSSLSCRAMVRPTTSSG